MLGADGESEAAGQDSRPFSVPQGAENEGTGRPCLPVPGRFRPGRSMIGFQQAAGSHGGDHVDAAVVAAEGLGHEAGGVGEGEPGGLGELARQEGSSGKMMARPPRLEFAGHLHPDSVSGGPRLSAGAACSRDWVASNSVVVAVAIANRYHRDFQAGRSARQSAGASACATVAARPGRCHGACAPSFRRCSMRPSMACSVSAASMAMLSTLALRSGSSGYSCANWLRMARKRGQSSARSR